MRAGSSEALPGRVLLVGAGPGDPDLITLRGVEALRSADVVLYDELATTELLDHAPATAERIDVGKRGHDAAARTQDDINRLLIERSRAGQCVVRLKGGDPFVFGRGGEEASACVAAGIAYEVVPGVTSAIAALAYAGIPITDRRHAASFAVVTGHKDPSEPGYEMRLGQLASAVDTLVILMGMRNLEELIAKVLEGGRDPETPAAVVRFGTSGDQSTVVAPLAKLAEEARAAGLRAPAAVVIGNVVKLRETLGWWEQMPLFGMRVLVTRTPEQAAPLASALRTAGARPVLAPMIRLLPAEDSSQLDAGLRRLRDYDAIVFTSANALRFTLQRARELGLEATLRETSARVVCGGAQTARAAVEAGLPVHFVPAAASAEGRRGSGDAEALLAQLSTHLEPRGRRFLLPRSEIGREVLADGLAKLGAEVDAVVAYRNVPPAEERAEELRAWLRRDELDVLTFASPSAVRHLVALLGEEERSAMQRCILAAVGPTTAAALESLGFRADVVPDWPDAKQLVAALVEYVRRGGREKQQ